MLALFNKPSAHARARVTVVGSVCLSVCVCLSGENKLLRSLMPVINSGYSIYMTNSRFKTCGFR